MTTATREQLDKIIDGLRGQCVHDMEHFAEHEGLSIDDLTIQDCQYIDDHVFYCTMCGWWCDIDELADDEDGTRHDLICTECDE